MNSVGPAPLNPPVTICVLCYGDHAPLAERVLGSLLRHTGRDDFQIRLGLNAVSPATELVLERLLPRFNLEMLVRSDANIYKEPMLRRLVHDRPIETGWTIWFDDDSFVFRGDWLAMLCCESALCPEVDMWGRKCFIRGGDRHREFIRAAPWYRGMEPEADDGPGGCRIHFVVGGYWAIRTSWLYRLDWPDRRLLHFGDDYMFGEALRQNSALVGNAFSGVAISRAPRRAPPGTPRCDALN